MKTRTIPVEQWLSYLNDLSVIKRKANVCLELRSDEFGNKVLVDKAPLLGVFPEMKGSEACAVDIEVGQQRIDSSDRLTHSVICTSKLVVEEDDQGLPQALDICGEDPDTQAKITTVIRFLP